MKSCLGAGRVGSGVSELSQMIWLTKRHPEFRSLFVTTLSLFVKLV